MLTVGHVRDRSRQRSAQDDGKESYHLTAIVANVRAVALTEFPIGVALLEK